MRSLRRTETDPISVNTAIRGLQSQLQGVQPVEGEVTFTAGVWLRELSADPSDPPEGESVIWQSDGTGTGDDGDILMKITAGGSTKTATLVDFSAI